MDPMRGTVTKIVFSIEYPDGSKKESTYVPTENLNGVLFSEVLMNDDMKNLFTVARDDWKKNPAMIIADGDTLIPNCDYPQCQNA